MNKFTNDGSFMEQFRKRMESQKSNNEEDKRKESTGKCVSHSDNNEASSSSSNEIAGPAVSPTGTRTDTLPAGPSPMSSSTKNTDCIDDDDTKKSNVKSTDANDGSLTVKKKHSVLSFVGKRPGSKLTLKTGQVKKKRQQEESEPKDAWSQYMAEVKKFRKGLDDDGKNRPLIK